LGKVEPQAFSTDDSPSGAASLATFGSQHRSGLHFIADNYRCSVACRRKNASRSFVAVILGLAAFGLLLIDLFAQQQLHELMRRPVGLPVSAAVLFLFLYCGGVILHSLLTSERVYVDEIIGTFNIYLVIGFTCAYVYLLLELSAPGSFQTADANEGMGLRFIYFSFITLTTVGFGDTARRRQAPLHRCLSYWRLS